MKNMLTEVVKLLLTYLQTTPTWRKITDVVLIITLSLSLAGAYILANYFDLLFSELRPTSSAQLNKELLQNLENSRIVNGILEDLRSISGAHRATIILYHNGRRTINGIPFLYRSMTHEVLAPGISSVIQARQNIPIGVEIDQSSKYVRGECSYLVNIHDDTAFGQLVNKGGATIIHNCPLLDKNGSLIGSVGISYVNTKEVPVERQVQEEFIRRAAKLLAPLKSNV